MHPNPLIRAPEGAPAGEPKLRADRLETPCVERKPADDADSGKQSVGLESFQRDGDRSGWIERRAKLFEAGAYPDKGVVITPDHLDAIAAAFDAPVPVLIEHSESPLELGFLTKVEALDGELFGTVSLSREANDLVERSGARSLSIGLSPDLTEIREVSLVRNPRVPDAQLFHVMSFSGNLEDGMWRADPAQGAACSACPDTDDASLWRSRYEQLLAQHRREHAGRQVEEFVRAGKLCPAQAPFAKALLQAEDTIEFGEDMASVRELLIAMIERQPPLQLFAALAPSAHQDANAALLLPEEAEFYRKHFPDVSLDEIAARKAR